MKQKKYISTLIIILLPLLMMAQSNYFYYYKGEKIYLNLDTSFLHISTNTNVNKSSLNIPDIKPFTLQNENTSVNGITNKWAKVELNGQISVTKYFQIINQLKNKPDIEVVSPSFNLNGERIGTSSFLYVKLKQSSDFNILQQKANEKNLIIVEQNQFMPLWYTLKATKNTIENTVKVAAFLYETGLFKEAVPDLLTYNDIDSNDPYYYDQWGLNNTGQNNGVQGIDININNAWGITEGNNNTVIAVLDHGIELNHPDINNLYSLSYDTESNSSPSQVLGNHGTACAGIIGADKDNGIGIAGISPNCKLMSISNSLSGTPNSRIKRADGINWAWQNGADVISNSWHSGVQYPQIDDAINNALQNGRSGKGTVIVFAAGNSDGDITYPANSNELIITVGAMSPCGERKNPSSCDGENWWGSCFGEQLDIMAPGVLVPTTDRQGNNGYNPQYENDPNYSNLDYFSHFNGTSSATPHVAAIAGLILSINPCLSVKQVNDIIEHTAQKVRTDLYSYTNQSGRPNGTWNNQMGYGLVDAYAAVQLAQQMNSSTLDLYVKDRPDDMGIEPNPTPDNMWISSDIWIRNVDDGGLSHQNPEYNSNGNPNYIYVRVINKSCVASTGNETLTINWAKANTALAWPDNWDGSLSNPGGYPLGGELNSVTIPVIQPGDEAIVKVPWVVPNPNDYSDNSAPWHFCLLARINDGNSVTMTSNPNVMVRNENNLAWKNVTVVDLEDDTTTATVMIANPSHQSRTYYLELIKDNKENGKAVYEEAEVTLKMDDVLFDAWERGGKIALEVEEKQDEKEKLVKGNNVLLDNIAFNPNEMGLLTLDFKFLTEQVTDKEKFTYHVIQRDATTGEIIGGETFIIKKKQRPLFVANAGDDKEVDLNETITITAEDINEIAEYNWYDSEGNLIYQGKDLSVSTDVTKKYKLEVVTADGFKDYDEVEIKLRPGYIQTISPNPSSNTINVDYKLNGATSAYIMVIGTNNGTSNNYIIDTNSNSISIDVSSYQTGYYTVALVCNGQITDAKQLLKQ